MTDADLLASILDGGIRRLDARAQVTGGAFAQLAPTLSGALDELATRRQRVEAELRLVDELQTDLSRLLARFTPDPTPPTTPTSPRPARERPTADSARARWQPVFDWVTTHKLAGTYSLQALTLTFGSWARNWSAVAIKYGVVIPTGARPTPPAGNDPNPAAATTPAPKTPPTPTTTPPAAQRQVPVVHAATGSMVLACKTCDSTFETSEIAKLRTHTTGIHGRPPTITERTPRKNEDHHHG